MKVCELEIDHRGITVNKEEHIDYKKLASLAFYVVNMFAYKRKILIYNLVNSVLIWR